MSNVVRTIETNEQQLNDLFKEVLDGLRDDIIETQENVKQYQDAIANNPNQGIDIYGQTLNQALSVKGSARDRQLKFLNTFKERVTKKEAAELSKELKNVLPSGGYDHMAMNRMMEDMKAAGNFKLAPINIEEDEDEDI